MSVADVRESIVGKTVVIQRNGDRTENVPVAKVTSVKGGTVNFNDGAKSRSARAEAIIATK
ncbi:MAG: hypothetical protein U5K30_14095 [Acidimicrobiales bacterium]|nr:hypothetical protein [Acidimicrobiales bacterium]